MINIKFLSLLSFVSFLILDILSAFKKYFGESVVFTSCAILAYLIIHKNAGLTSMNKIGIMIRSAGSCLLIYNIVNRSKDFFGVPDNRIVLNGSIHLNNVNLTANSNYPIPKYPVLDYLFGMNPNIN